MSRYEKTKGRGLLEYLDRAEKLSSKYAGSLEEVKRAREKASYGIGEVRSEEAENTLRSAQEFVSTIKQMVYAKKGIRYEVV